LVKEAAALQHRRERLRRQVAGHKIYHDFFSRVVDASEDFQEIRDITGRHYTLASTREVSTFIHSFIPAISIASFQVLYYSEALPTTARIGLLYRSFTPKRNQPSSHISLIVDINIIGLGSSLTLKVR